MEVIQDNLVMIIGGAGLLILVLMVFFVIRKRRKKKGEKAEFVVPAKESIEPLHEEDEEKVEINEADESDYSPDKEVLQLESIRKGNRFFIIEMRAKEDGVKIRSIDPASNAYGSIYQMDELRGRSFHPRKPIFIHFDFNDRAVRRKELQLDMSIKFSDSEGANWTQRFVYDKAGECRMLKPHRA